MMPWIAGGILGVIALMAVMSGIANANPARIARIVRWLAVIGLAVLGAVFLSRRIYMLAFISWGAALAAWRTMGGAPGRSSAGGGRSSDVETEWVRMALDLDSGETTGVVLKGVHAGRRIEDLPLVELRVVLAEARINDPDAARLIEAYIARAFPDAEPEAANDSSPSSPQVMTREEALDVLGLRQGASSESIRDAHRRLMQQMHPDKGGSDYLAAKINAARDLLLKDA
jgi:hypothetical protein